MTSLQHGCSHSQFNIQHRGGLVILMLWLQELEHSTAPLWFAMYISEVLWC